MVVGDCRLQSSRVFSPHRDIDAHLGGNGRSKALAWSIGVSVALLLLVCSLPHARSTGSGCNICTLLVVVGGMDVCFDSGCVILQFLGFDDGSTRTELGSLELDVRTLLWFLMVSMLIPRSRCGFILQRAVVLDNGIVCAFTSCFPNGYDCFAGINHACRGRVEWRVYVPPNGCCTVRVFIRLDLHHATRSRQ